MRILRLAAATAIVAAMGAGLFAGEKPPEKPPIGPSANKGRAGTYQAETSRAGCNYCVYVPRSYSDDNPAGIHVYFHGQGGQGGAPSFGQWAAHFLDPFNLIGINMQYMDGDNAKDTPGKAAAALEAVQQVMKDYRIIPGRGVLCSFSGGGLPHGVFFNRYCKRAGKDAPAPLKYNHAGLYSSNYWASISGIPTMSCLIGLGSEEWNLASLGASQSGRFAELLGKTDDGGSLDIYFKVTKGKGHTITDADVADAARLFRRSDLASCPFLYAADYRESELRPIVAAANDLRLGKASSSVDALLATTNLADDIKKKAAALKAKIGKRVDAVLALAKELTEQDMLLTTYYLPAFEKQLAGHPKLEDLKKLVAESKKVKSYSNALAAWRNFQKGYRSFFDGNKLSAEAAPLLEKVKTAAGEQSLLGKMSAEFLLLK